MALVVLFAARTEPRTMSLRLPLRTESNSQLDLLPRILLDQILPACIASKCKALLLQVLWTWAVSTRLLKLLDHLLLYGPLLRIRILLWLVMLVLLWNIVDASDGAWETSGILSTCYAKEKSAINTYMFCQLMRRAQ